MTEAEIDEYVYENLPAFDGWMPQIRKLLAALLKNGWDKSIVFTAKEKYGKFVLRTAHENFSTFITIYDEFEEKINQTCMTCGDKGEHCSLGGWDYTYCLTHYIGESPKITNIDHFGFTLLEDRYYWKEIYKINGHSDYRGYDELKEDSEGLGSITLDLNPSFSISPIRELYHTWITNDQINWISFLKNIPDFVLDTNIVLKNYINNFLASFYFCEICGKKAVTTIEYDQCLLCHTSSWESMTERHQKSYRNKTNYIKENQLIYFSGGFNYELNKLEVSFEKNQNFRVLFSDIELQEYLKLINS